jgi:hypothetical protein
MSLHPCTHVRELSAQLAGDGVAVDEPLRAIGMVVFRQVAHAR